MSCINGTFCIAPRQTLFRDGMLPICSRSLTLGTVCSLKSCAARNPSPHTNVADHGILLLTLIVSRFFKVLVGHRVPLHFRTFLALPLISGSYL
jgi:hypothetical protein